MSSLWVRFIKGQGRKAAVGQCRFFVLMSVRDTWPLCCPGQDVSNDVWDLAANCIAVFWWESLLPRQRKLPLLCTHGTSGPGSQNFSKFVVTRLWPVLRMYHNEWIMIESRVGNDGGAYKRPLYLSQFIWNEAHIFLFKSIFIKYHMFYPLPLS